MIIDIPILVALLFVAFAFGWAFGWLSTRSEVERLKADKKELRERLEQERKTGSEKAVKGERDEMLRRHATEIEAAELSKQLKASELLKDGWQKAAKKAV